MRDLARGLVGTRRLECLLPSNYYSDMRNLPSPLRLLPLTTLVAFPNAPPYLLSASGVVDGETVGLVHRPCGGSTCSIGCIAVATSLSADAKGPADLFYFEAQSRFRLLEEMQRSSLGENDNVEQYWHARVVLFNDDDDDDGDADAEDGATELHAGVWQNLQSMQQLGGDGDGAVNLQWLEELAPGVGNPTDFSLALGGVLEMELHEAQALLECASSRRRLSVIKSKLERAVSFAAAQKALSGLSL